MQTFDLLDPHALAATFSDCSFLSIFWAGDGYAVAGFQQLEPCHNRGQWAGKFLDYADGATSLRGEHVSMTTQNQAT